MSEEADQDVHLVLQPVRALWYHHAIIGIEDSQTPRGSLSQPIMVHPLVLNCHGQPGSDDIIH